MSQFDYIARIALYVSIAVLSSLIGSRAARANLTDTLLSATLAAAITLRAFVDKSTSQRDTTKAIEQGAGNVTTVSPAVIIPTTGTVE